MAGGGAGVVAGVSGWLVGTTFARVRVRSTRAVVPTVCTRVHRHPAAWLVLAHGARLGPDAGGGQQHRGEQGPGQDQADDDRDAHPDRAPARRPGVRLRFVHVGIAHLGALEQRLLPGTNSGQTRGQGRMGPVRVLVVEDERLLADTIADGLRRHAIAVDVAYDGDVALDRLRVTDYDVVVLDRDLPRVSGDEVCTALVAAGAGPRILMLTASTAITERVA